MTSITIVFDNDMSSREGLENWADALIEENLINAGHVSRVLINNKEYLNRKDISNMEKFFNNLKKIGVKDEI